MQPSLFPIDIKTALLGALKRGAAHGKREVDLVEELGVNGRAIRKAVSAMRREGILVCGLPSEGYYIATTVAEAHRTLSNLRKRALHSFQDIRGFKRGLLELAGQRRIKT